MGRATDAIAADMSKSAGNFVRDAVSTTMVAVSYTHLTSSAFRPKSYSMFMAANPISNQFEIGLAASRDSTALSRSAVPFSAVSAAGAAMLEAGAEAVSYTHLKSKSETKRCVRPHRRAQAQ